MKLIKELYIEVYLVEGANFSEAQTDYLLERTAKKLLRAGIKLKWGDILLIKDAALASVHEDNVEQLLTYKNSSQGLHLFLIKEDLSFGHDSWTYNPLDEFAGNELFNGVIFLTQNFADNTDEHYAAEGYHPQCDSLLHELGHILLDQAEHETSVEPNFMHADAYNEDDTLTSKQIALMRESRFLS